MSSMVQVRGVPDEVHRALKGRAAEAGESLNAYLLGLFAQEVARPRTAEVLERAARRAERATATAATARVRPERIELPQRPATAAVAGP